MGLHDSMKRFGNIRRNPVAIEEHTERPLDGDKDQQEEPTPLVN